MSNALVENVAENMLEESSVKVYTAFDEMNLPESLMRGIYANGFVKPSDIQSKGIMPIKEGRDLLAQAKSGTGKTGTFMIGALSRVDPTLKRVQVMVLAPTRELAQQIEGVSKALSQYMGPAGANGQSSPLNVYSATGGGPVRDDSRELDRGCQILIGTPGRIYDLMNRKLLNRDNIRLLILDEADQMLEDRFKEQVMCILALGFPKETRVALFSATMDEAVRNVANSLLQNPVKILVNQEGVQLDGIKNYYVVAEREDWKVEILADLYQRLTINQALIYCNQRKKAEMLAEKMAAQGFPLSVIHGELDKNTRATKMKEFRTGAVRVMISTDLLSRGIDVQQVSLVINFELPSQKESYIHRIGRAGRFGRKGVTINLIDPAELNVLQEIGEHWKIPMELLPEDLSKLPM
jgi:translation initiation factor 4A